MNLKYVRDSLPWLVPSAAIVFAASGFLERSEPEPSAAVPQPDLAIVAPSEQPLLAPAEPEAVPEIVARQSTAASPLGGVDVPPTALAQPQTALPIAPLTPDEPPVERQAALASASAATPFFQSSAIASAAREQCIEDLRNLASTARVYFPSGGLTADEGGIEQGRLIGLVAQNCQGVQIRVEGHSDPSGDPDANLRLSQQRAEQVITRIAASGIDTSMFYAEGLGDRQPSNISGPEPTWYYDRRVEFSIVAPEQVQRVALRTTPAATVPWANAACVTELQQAVSASALFYAPRSVSVRADEFETALRLATMAVECPHARLRIIGHHSADIQAGESVATGILRAKALMAMLVGRGIASEQVIIAAPSRPMGAGDQLGLPGSRVSFDVILEEG